tara:strand:- start:1450 stop:2679 length:1230 start_codon:yes stop_codon:yes gene_type:complete
MKGDVINKLKEIDDNSIDIIITSPPYFNQRDYGTNMEQWGNEKSVDKYIEKMSKWSNECFRVLKMTGSLWLNIGDKYGKNKELLLIPEKLIIEMSKQGWILRNKIIWYKKNYMPEGVKDRLTNTWEPIYFFIKNNKKWYKTDYYSNIDNIRIDYKTKEKKSIFPKYIEIKDYTKEFENKLTTYNNKKLEKYKGKYKKNSKNIGRSAGGRQSTQGIKYILQRKNKINFEKQQEIANFLKKSKNNFNKGLTRKDKLTNKKIDNEFNKKDTASHWFRTDRALTTPNKKQWIKLKKILNLEETLYDKIIMEEHYISNEIIHNKKGKNLGDMWSIDLEKTKNNHIAVFPLQLPITILKGFCPKNAVCLDTFGGSGTTGLACKNLGIKECILIENNEKYIEIIKSKCNIFQNNLN